MAPLRREWAAVRDQMRALSPEDRKPTRKDARHRKPQERSKERKALKKLVRDFVERLAHVTILDPACGSGNFLYVALHLLLDLEKEVITYAARHGLGCSRKCARRSWTGSRSTRTRRSWRGGDLDRLLAVDAPQRLQPRRSNPVLEPIETIRRKDAILDLSDPEHPKEPEWPEAEFIVGNPPFLMGGKLRSELPDKFEAIFSLYKDRIPNASDLCCYWFEKSRSQIEKGRRSDPG